MPDIVLTSYVDLEPQAVSPGPPLPGKVRLYVDSNEALQAVQPDGTEEAVGGPGGGSSISGSDGVNPPEAITDIVAAGATVGGGTATLWPMSIVAAAGQAIDISVTAMVDGATAILDAGRALTGTDLASVSAITTITAAGDALADTIVETTGVEDASAKTTVTALDGNADVSRSAIVSTVGTNGADALGNTYVSSAAGNAEGRTQVFTGAGSWAKADIEVATVDGLADGSAVAYSVGAGSATVNNDATVAGAGLATASAKATSTAGTSGLVALADATSARMGFYGVTPIAKPTGVAVDAAAIHAALVSLGLISA